jgi:AcrR family transcriptional regulator
MMNNQLLSARATRAGRARRVRRTQAERRAHSANSILAAAAQLFAERGYVDTTMEQIGARAGFSAGLVAQRFGSKFGVVEALLAKIREGTSAAIARDDDGSVELFVSRYVDLVARRESGVRALYVLMAEALGPLRERADLFAEHNRAVVAEIRARIVRAQREGRASAELDSRALAVQLLARIRGATLLWLIDPKLCSPRQLKQELVEALAERRIRRNA